jgi:hypothetical protein
MGNVQLQGGYRYHQYQVVGRHLPTEKEPEPTIYRMKLWATDPVRAKSKFWCVRRHLLVHCTPMQGSTAHLHAACPAADTGFAHWHTGTS